MEKKTIGGFIAALRKANGMTQKDLAQRLNVSDKTVSRWERDDGAPDLSVVPVIAEIFGVTCDELLRGERKKPEERTNVSEEGTAKGEKERQRLLSLSLAQYRDRTLVAMGISLAGLIAASIANLAFLKAVLGFLLGTVFFAASLICQAVFLNRAFLSVEEGELSFEELSRFKRKVIDMTQWSVGLTVAFVGFTFPLVLMDAFVGLSADNMLLFGLPGAGIFLAIYGVACWFLSEQLICRGVYVLKEKEARIYSHNHKLKQTCFLGLAGTLAVTMLFHAFGSEMIWNTENLAQGTEFHDYESFIAYMGQDVSYDGDTGQFTENLESDEPIWYYDEQGNRITEEQALARNVEDVNGKVLFTYVHRNDSVTHIRYSAKEGTVLPITVITTQQWRQGASLSGLISGLYCVLYPLEILAAVMIYFKKREK